MRCQFCGATLESLPVRCPFCASQPVLGDRYEINATIGRGGMGEVFLAHDRRLDNDVAIKRLTPQLASSSELRTSLQREAQIMARLSDAGIVRLFDLAEFYGDFYLILEYVPGPTLRDMIRSGYRPSPQELAKVVGEICQGLTVAHNAGVVHRDLKPSNMLLALSGAEKQAYIENHQLPASLANAKVKITDFGIAKAIADSRLTVTNAFSGTPGYMAPEQFRGETPSPQTDVYALGVVTYELLTGTLPQHPIADVPTVHPAVTQVIRMALSALRQNRFASAAAFYEALYHAIEGRSPVPPAPVPARRALSGTQVSVLALAVFIGLVSAIALVMSLSRRPETTARYTSLPAPTPSPIPKPLPPIEWHSFPKVSEPPPVVEEARGKLSDPVGPDHPKVEWEIVLPDFRPNIAAIGTDGTVYLTNQGQIGAARNGKLLWAYQNTEFGADIEDLNTDSDGRVWFKMFVMGEYEFYCLNRDGQGGRLPRSFENRGPKYVDKAPYSCWKNKHTLSGPEGDMDLEDGCKKVALGREGRIWVATDAPEILGVNRRLGKIETKYKPPCEPSALLPTVANQIAFTCPDGSLHQIKGAAELWSHPGDGAIAYATTVTDGTIYFGEGQKNAKGGHLRAIDVQGKLLWTVDLPEAPEGAIAIGQRRIYLLQKGHGFSSANRLIGLSD
ncbi:MAG TPA: protein kinase [Bryobacteraceae bacterium]|nr:protein kinase [Bryobacteraceae bacterium]